MSNHNEKARLNLKIQILLANYEIICTAINNQVVTDKIVVEVISIKLTLKMFKHQTKPLKDKQLN